MKSRKKMMPIFRVQIHTAIKIPIRGENSHWDVKEMYHCKEEWHDSMVKVQVRSSERFRVRRNVHIEWEDESNNCRLAPWTHRKDVGSFTACMGLIHSGTLYPTLEPVVKGVCWLGLQLKGGNYSTEWVQQGTGERSHFNCLSTSSAYVSKLQSAYWQTAMHLACRGIQNQTPGERQKRPIDM